MITSQAPPVYGGAGAQALALAAALVSRGFTVDLLTLNQAAAPLRETYSGVNIIRCPGERLLRRVPGSAVRVVRMAWFLIWLTWRLSSRSYDVFHTHGSYWFSLPPAVLGRLRRIPVVLKVTRLDDDDAVTTTSRRLLGLPVGFVYAAPTRLATTVIALNPEIERRHKACFPRVPVRRLPNGVEVDRFRTDSGIAAAARRSLGISQEAAVVAFAGYLTNLKGVDDLVEVWLQLAARGRNARPAVLLLAGPSGGGYRYLSKEVVARARSSQAESAGIRVLGHLPSDAMPLIYAAADVFVLPSKSEGMPNSLLEALAAGLPIIGSAIPGISELLERDPDSIVLSSANVDSLREALSNALARPQSRDGDRPSRLPPEYSMAHLACEYERLYARIKESGRVGLQGVYDQLGKA